MYNSIRVLTSEYKLNYIDEYALQYWYETLHKDTYRKILQYSNKSGRCCFNLRQLGFG